MEKMPEYRSKKAKGVQCPECRGTEIIDSVNKRDKEDHIFYCEKCEYSWNYEVAQCKN